MASLAVRAQTCSEKSTFQQCPPKQSVPVSSIPGLQPSLPCPPPLFLPCSMVASWLGEWEHSSYNSAHKGLLLGIGKGFNYRKQAFRSQPPTAPCFLPSFLSRVSLCSPGWPWTQWHLTLPSAGISLPHFASEKNVLIKWRHWLRSGTLHPCQRPEVAVHICNPGILTTRWRDSSRSSQANSPRVRSAADGVGETLSPWDGRWEPVPKGGPLTCAVAHPCLSN